MLKVSPSCYCQLVTVVAIVPDDFDDCNCPNENCLRGRNRQYNVHTRTFYNHSQLKEQNKNTIFLTANITFSETFTRMFGMNDVILQIIFIYNTWDCVTDPRKVVNIYITSDK